MKEVRAAALRPFRTDGPIDEAGTLPNIPHRFEDLGIDGMFIAGKRGEFFSMTMRERMRVFEFAVDAVRGTGAGTILSRSDRNKEAAGAAREV